jgi:hypothetical protein
MTDLDAVHERLKAILEQYRAGLALEVPGLEGKPWGYVAGTRLGKRYVSYYLMGVYARPELAEGMSSELKRRMQGKSCFNFTKVDGPLFAELEALTARCIQVSAQPPSTSQQPVPNVR